MKNTDGTVDRYPTSGGADRFLDFIQTELIPEIDRRYRTEACRIFTGHSLGGLIAIYILVNRPEMFQAYIASSPSLWWDDQHTLRQAQVFFAARAELKKEFFFSLAHEGDSPSDRMVAGFDELKKMLEAKTPKNFRWDSARFLDETHSSTELRSHYAGLRTIFANWQTPVDASDGIPVGGLEGMEKHYRELSDRFGYQIPIPEKEVNRLGYRLMARKRFNEAISVFQRNVELYPDSANVYDSLGEGYENMGKYVAATEQVQKAIDAGTKTGDPELDAFKTHLKQVTAKAKAAAEKPATQK